MTWIVLTVERFDAWFLSLSPSAQSDVLAAIVVLEELGPTLGRPLVDTLKGTKLSNLKELRIQHKGEPYRVLFAFDPMRRAVLLCGGSKKNNPRIYEKLILEAELEFVAHLESLEQ